MSTPSHSYRLQWKGAAGVLLGPGVFALLLGSALALMGRSGILPRPWPVSDMDRTIVLHQAAAAERASAADVLLLGDSACLLDIRADLLSRMLRRRVLSLATLSYLRADAQEVLLRRYLENARRRPEIILIAFHPDSLRWPRSEKYYLDLMADWWAGRLPRESARGRRGPRWPGTDDLKYRLLSRVFVHPVPASFFPCYGFTRSIWRWMETHGGSLAACGSTGTVGGAQREWRLSPATVRAGRSLAGAVPDGCWLAVALAPVPAGHGGRNPAAALRQLLAGWAAALSADMVMDGLPLVLPASLFSDQAHLNRRGAVLYSRLVGQILLRRLSRGSALAAAGEAAVTPVPRAGAASRPLPR